MEIIVVVIKNFTFHPEVLVQNGLYRYEVTDGRSTFYVMSTQTNVKIGMHTLFAPEGSTTPRGLKIKNTAFKDMASDGILCTLKDLDLSHDEEGIIDLPPTTRLGIGLKEVPRELLSSTPWYQYKLIESFWENKQSKKISIVRTEESPLPSADWRLISQTYFHDNKYLYRSFF